MARLNRDQKRIKAAQALANFKGQIAQKAQSLPLVPKISLHPSGKLYYTDRNGVRLPFVSILGGTDGY